MRADQEPPTGQPVEVLLGTDTTTNEPVLLSGRDRSRGLLVMGGTGVGKTTLLEHLILTDLRAGIPIVLLDPHGDLARRVASLAPPEAKIVYYDAESGTPFSLNLLELPDLRGLRERERDETISNTVGHVTAVFEKLYQDSPQSYAPRLERDLPAALHTVLAGNGTLLDIPRVFRDKAFRGRLLLQVTNQGVREHWAWWDSLPPREQMIQPESTLNRLVKFLMDARAREIFGQPVTSIPFSQVLEGECSLILRLPLGSNKTLSSFLGAVFLSVLTNRIFAREALPESLRPPIHLYLDEHYAFSTEATTELLVGGRKYAVATTLAHQYLAQIPDPRRQQAELQAGSVLLFRLTQEDAEVFTGRFDATPTRTKVVSRLRKEMKYRTTEEHIWDPPEMKAQHDGLQQELGRVQYDPADRTLLLRKARYYTMEEAWLRCGGLEFDRLLEPRSSLFAEAIEEREVARPVGWPTNAGVVGEARRLRLLRRLVRDPERDRRAHLPFNPGHWNSIYPGSTVVSLREVGTPDFWNPLPHEDADSYFPHEDLYSRYLDDPLCEGYAIRRRDKAEEDLVYNSIESQLFTTVSKFWGEWHGYSFSEARWKQIGSLVTPELHNVAGQLMHEICELDDEIYRDATFWFWPHSRNPVEEKWLQASRPQLGHARGKCEIIREDESRVRYRPDWPEMGLWQVTAFPQAVGWMRQWVRKARAELATLSKPAQEREDYRRYLKAEADRILQTHHRLEVSQEEAFEWTVRVADPDSMSRYNELAQNISRQGKSSGLGGRNQYGLVYPPEERESYENVEELDQTFADRQAEIANSLSILPLFTSYYVSPDGQERRVLIRPPEQHGLIDPSRIEEMRQRTQALYAVPSNAPDEDEKPLSGEQPPPSIPPSTFPQPESDAPPVRPISRRHPD